MTGRLLWLCSLLALSSSLQAEVSLELRHLWKGRVFSIPSGPLLPPPGKP